MRKTVLEVVLVAAITAGVAIAGGSAWSQKKGRLKVYEHKGGHLVSHRRGPHRHHRGIEIETKKGAR